jgi:spermidine/putrescine ABC transporter ATP-binding subunit
VEAELEVDGLIKTYSEQVTVGPISFEVGKGEFFSLLGPSGCGKTTTLRCIAGFEHISAGAIRLGGERIDRKPAHRRDIGLVFQSYALFPHLSVFDNIAFGLKLRGRGDVRDRVTTMLELVGLPEVAQRFPAQLSGGQQQRIAIARALVLEPPLMMFDEPLSNLDFKLRVQMRSELRRLQQQLGKTSIYVTHDQTEALALSDRIAVLSQGKIEQIGPPHEIYERPRTQFVAEFIGNSNILVARWIPSAEEACVVETRGGLRLKLAVGQAQQSAHSVVLLIRPELIRFVETEDQALDGNRFEAEVEEITYLGEDLQLRCLTRGGERLLTAFKGNRHVRVLHPGDTVRLAIAADDIHVLGPSGAQ